MAWGQRRVRLAGLLLWCEALLQGRAIWLCGVQVDGGLAPSTIGEAAAHGANAIVAGSSVFNAQEPGEVMQTLRAAVTAAAAKPVAA